MSEQDPLATTLRLEADLPPVEDERRRAEAEAQAANTQYTIGLVAVLLGVIGLLFFWPLVLLALPGALAAITQAAKRSRARDQVRRHTELINAWRVDLAEARARLAAGSSRT